MKKLQLLSEEVLPIIERVLLTEGAETRNMKAAKHFLMDKLGCNEEQSLQIIGSIKHDIPNSRLAKCKYMLAMCRMYTEKQLSDATIVLNVNKCLKYAALNSHINEYNQDLNGMSAQQFVEKFNGLAQADLENDKTDVANQQYNTNTSYQIVKIENFEQSTEYCADVTWCVTQDEEAYDSYTANGLRVFYFCLRDGYENEEEVKGENCPLDSYGLSMIAVSVNEDGSCNTCTCRWNHDNGGNDNIMDTKQISQVIGRNFYEVFKPLSKEEIAEKQTALFNDILSDLEERLYNYGEELDDICDVEESDPYFNNNAEENIYIYRKSTNGNEIILNDNCEPIIEETFDDVNTRRGDILMVSRNNKWNFLRINGTYVSDTWFDRTSNYFEDGYGIVLLNRKFNYILPDGSLILKEWADSVQNFSKNDVAEIQINGETTFVNRQGERMLQGNVEKTHYERQLGIVFIQQNGMYKVYCLKPFKLYAPWEIEALEGLRGVTLADGNHAWFYQIKLTDGNRYLIDGHVNLRNMYGEIVQPNPYTQNSPKPSNESKKRLHLLDEENLKTIKAILDKK